MVTSCLILFNCSLNLSNRAAFQTTDRRWSQMRTTAKTRIYGSSEPHIQVSQDFKPAQFKHTYSVHPNLKESGLKISI